MTVGGDETREMTVEQARCALADLSMLLAVHDDPNLFERNNGQ